MKSKKKFLAFLILIFTLIGGWFAEKVVGQTLTETPKQVEMRAKKGDPEAQYNLGVMYENGNGVKQNYEEAIKWYRKAADQGLAKAIEALNAIEVLKIFGEI